MLVVALLLAKLGPTILEPDLDSGLLQIDMGRQLFSQGDIRILSLIEDCLQLS